MEKLKIGWFSTGRDEAARQLLTVVQNSIREGEIKGKISFVFSDRESGESKESDLFFKLVERYHFPLICFSSKKFQSFKGYKHYSIPWHLEYDREVMKRLVGFHSDFCVLTGYMLIVGEEMCDRYPMINLHPGAPGGPTGTWQEVIWQLIENRARETGVMMHLVTPELDKGPPVTYCTFSIKDDSNQALWEAVKKGRKEARWKLFWEIRRRGLQREFPLIVATLKTFSEGKVEIDLGKRQVIDSQGVPISGYNLTEEVEKNLKGGVRWKL